MGPLQGLPGEEDKFAVEADDLQKSGSLNDDVKDDCVEHNTIGCEQITCKHDGVSSTIIGWKSYHQGRECCTHHQEARCRDHEVDEVWKF